MKSQYNEIIVESTETVGIASDYPSTYDDYYSYDPAKVSDLYQVSELQSTPQTSKVVPPLSLTVRAPTWQMWH